MKYLKYFLVFAALVAIFHFTIKHSIESGIPPFISEKLDELLRNEALMDSIGESPRYEFSFNSHEYNLKDTVRYTIKVKGTEKTLVYEGVQVKGSSENWSLFKQKMEIK